MLKKSRLIFTILLGIVLLWGFSTDCYARKKGKTAVKKETSTEVKKQHQTAQDEIRSIRAKITENDEKIKRGVAELNQLNADIDATKKNMSHYSSQVASLQTKIAQLEVSVAQSEKKLQLLRSKYLQAVKKMRKARGNRSKLAFLFSAKNFSQAMRRMRYLREFARWRDRQTEDIKKTIAELNKDKALLSASHKEKNFALSQHLESKKNLDVQYARQDELVASLRKNGDVLKAYLAQKQAEANELKNRIGAIIIAEQQAKEAERLRKVEAAKKVEVAKKAEAAKKAEQARQAANAKKDIAPKVQTEKEKKNSPAVESAKKKQNKNFDKKESAPKEAVPTKSRNKDRVNKSKEVDKEKKVTSSKEKEKTQKPEKKVEKKKEDKKIEDKKKNDTTAKQPAKEEKVSSPPLVSHRNDDRASYAAARKRRPRSQKNTETSTSGKKNEKEPVTKEGKPRVAENKSKETAEKKNQSSSGFGGSKGSLPRPVDGSWKVVIPFGVHPLPELPSVKYDNPGIDVQVSPGSTAKAVYPGVVSGVYQYKGYGTVVLISHGSYYTIYANLSSASVHAGENVKQGQTVGKVFTDKNDKNRTIFHFEVWHNRNKLNPQEWIK